MNSFELGKVTPNTNSIPGAKECSFFAALDGGKRVSIDATNKQIVIEEGGVPSSVVVACSSTDALMDLEGINGSIHLRTVDCTIQGIDGLLPRIFAARIVKSCDASDPAGQTFVRGVIATPRIRTS